MSWRLVALQTAPAGDLYEETFLALASGLAVMSAHPAAPDIRRAAKTAGVTEGTVAGFKDFPSRGFGGLVQLPAEEAPRAVLVGDLDFLEESGLQIPAILEVARRRFMADGHRTIVGGWDGYVRGVMKFLPAPPEGSPGKTAGEGSSSSRR